MATPVARSSRMTAKSCSTSPRSRLDVGSSRIRTRASRTMARLIATSCWTARSGWTASCGCPCVRPRLLRCSAACVGARPSSRSGRGVAAHGPASRSRRRTGSGRGSPPGTPWRCRRPGHRRSSGTPPAPRPQRSRRSRPAYTPVSALMKVDFPAPFSPMRAWISPGAEREVDAVQGEHPGEADGDATHLDDRGSCGALRRIIARRRPPLRSWAALRQGSWRTSPPIGVLTRRSGSTSRLSTCVSR